MQMSNYKPIKREGDCKCPTRSIKNRGECKYRWPTHANQRKVCKCQCFSASPSKEERECKFPCRGVGFIYLFIFIFGEDANAKTIGLLMKNCKYYNCKDSNVKLRQSLFCYTSNIWWKHIHLYWISRSQELQ